MIADHADETMSRIPPRLLELLSGLQRQREELGSVADELIDLFRAHGIALPPDFEGERHINP
jgi:hypothetical protein